MKKFMSSVKRMRIMRRKYLYKRQSSTFASVATFQAKNQDSRYLKCPLEVPFFSNSFLNCKIQIGITNGDTHTCMKTHVIVIKIC